MLYRGIDQHARQLAISRRDETGDVLQILQVSTRPEKVYRNKQLRDTSSL